MNHMLYACRYIQNFGFSTYLGRKRYRKDKSLYIPFIKGILEDRMAEEIAAISRQVDFSPVTPVPMDDFHIFVFWWQGEEEMPRLVRTCVDSIRRAAGHTFSVVLITRENYRKWIHVDPRIENYVRDGIMTLAHFSDILRFALLEKYGGAWLDATMWVTEPFEAHPVFYENSLFSIKAVGRPENQTFASFGRWTGFCLATSTRHHPLFQFGKEFLEAYWKKYSILLDYFLIDYIISIAYDRVPVIRDEIDHIPDNNGDVHYLQRHMNDRWDDSKQNEWDTVRGHTWMFKLSWKQKITEGTDTYYSHLLSDVT